MMTRHQPAIPSPGFLRSRRVWVALLVLFLFPFFIHIPRSLNHHPVISTLGDQVHIILFGGITLLLYWFGPLQGRIWRAAIVSAVMGGAVEFLQLLVGRQALFKDFLLDGIGVGIVVSFVIWKGHGRNAGKWVLVLLLLTLPVELYRLPWQIVAIYRCRDMFPALANFDSYGDRYLWNSTNKGKLSFTRIADSPTGEGHVLRSEGGPETHWPGASMRRFPEDWAAYSELKMDVRLVDAPVDSFKFAMRLDDYEGIKELIWVAQAFMATRQWQTFTMPIDDRQMWNSERNLNLAEMDRLLIYLLKPQDQVTIEIDNIRLE